MSKFEQISAFITVIEARGFAAAARKLGISTAAISRQITNLEATLGVQLLLRSTRQLTPTPTGQQYYQDCKKIMVNLQEAEAAIFGSQQEAVGILRVTSSRYFTITYLLPRLSEFMEQNPKLRIHLELAERFPDLAQESIDILFGISLEGPRELVRKRVSTVQYILCASPQYLKQFGIPQTPEDLHQHRYITHSIRQPNNVLGFRNGKEIFLEPFLWLNDSYAMRNCALQGMGIIKLHNYMVKDELRDGHLIELLPDLRDPPQPIFLYYQQSRYLQPKIRRFIDFFTESLSLT